MNVWIDVCLALPVGMVLYRMNVVIREVRPLELERYETDYCLVFYCFYKDLIILASVDGEFFSGQEAGGPSKFLFRDGGIFFSSVDLLTRGVAIYAIVI